MACLQPSSARFREAYSEPETSKPRSGLPDRFIVLAAVRVIKKASAMLLRRHQLRLLRRFLGTPGLRRVAGSVCQGGKASAQVSSTHH